MVLKMEHAGKGLRRPGPLQAPQETPVIQDIAKRFEQLENQWLSFQRKSAERDETKTSLASSPHLLSSFQEGLQYATPSQARKRSPNLRFSPKLSRASGRGRGKSRARTELLDGSPTSRECSDEDGNGDRRAGISRQRGSTVSFAGYAGRTTPAHRGPASVLDKGRVKGPIASAGGSNSSRAAAVATTGTVSGREKQRDNSDVQTYRSGDSGRRNIFQELGRRLLDRDGRISAFAASDPAIYSSGKGPPEKLSGGRDDARLSRSLPDGAPSSDRESNCQLDDSVRERSAKREQARNESWDGCHALFPDKPHGHRLKGAGIALVPDGGIASPFSKKRLIKESKLRFPAQDGSAQNWAKKQEVGVADVEASAKVVETGKVVLQTLCSCLRDVLQQFEQKDKTLQDYWHSLNHSGKVGSEIREYLSGFSSASKHLDGLSLLAEDASADNWAGPVISICKRLVALFGRETHLQKWAIVLEKETVRLLKIEDEVANIRASAAKEVERVSALEKLVEEKCRTVEEERLNLAKERETLSLWVSHLQERRKAVSECEKEAAASLADVQKRSANLFVRESAIDARALEISTLQEEVRIVSQRLHEDLEVITKEKSKIQEKLRQVAAKDRDAEAQLLACSKMQDDVMAQKKQLEQDIALAEEEKTKTAVLFQEMEDKLMEKENMLQCLQKQVQEAKLDVDSARQSVDTARACISKDRQEVDQYIRTMDRRLQEWEGGLINRETELLQQRDSIQELEIRVRGKQEHCELLHQKLLEEQQGLSEELKRRESTLVKRSAMQDQKHADIKREMEKLHEEQEKVLKATRNLSEMESRICYVSKGLRSKHEELLQQVHEDVKNYKARMEELEAMKRSLKSEAARGFEELSIHKEALQLWQTQLECSLEEKIKGIVKDKADLELYVQRLNEMQLQIERMGSQVTDSIQVLEQLAAKLELKQQNIEVSHSKVKECAEKLTKQQDSLIQRETLLRSKESKVLEAQNQLEHMAAEVQANNLSVKEREQTLINGMNHLQVVEAKLEDEKRSFEERVSKFQLHVANLERATANTEESLRTRAEALSRTERALAIEKVSLLTTLDKESSTKRDDVSGMRNELRAFELMENDQIGRNEFSQLNQDLSQTIDKAGDVEDYTCVLDLSWETLKEDLTTRKAIGSTHRSAKQLHFKGASKLEEIEAAATIQMSHSQHQETGASVPPHSQRGICDSGLSEKQERILNESEQQLEEGIDQRGRDIKDFWQRLRGARSDLDRIESEERKRTIEGLISSLAKKETAGEPGVAMGEGLDMRDSAPNAKCVTRTEAEVDDQRTKEGADKHSVQRDSVCSTQLPKSSRLVSEKQGTSKADLFAHPAVVAPRLTQRLSSILSSAPDRILEEHTLHALWQEQETVPPLATVPNIEKPGLAPEQHKTQEKKNVRSPAPVEGDKYWVSSHHAKDGLHLGIVGEGIEKWLNPRPAGSIDDNVERAVHNATVAADSLPKEEIAGVSGRDAESEDHSKLERSSRRSNRWQDSTPKYVKAGDTWSTDGANWMEHSTQISQGQSGIGQGFVNGIGGLAHTQYDFPVGTLEPHTPVRRLRIGDMFTEVHPSPRRFYRSTVNSDMGSAYGNLQKQASFHATSEVNRDKLLSQERLERVMDTLKEASQAGRDKLHQAENFLRNLQSSAVFVPHVTAALNDLSAKLNFMEQIEEGLSSQIEKAHMLHEAPGTSDEASVDRIQLLNRLQEQQSLRAEWEEDMQQYAQSLDALHSSPYGSSRHSSPQQFAPSAPWVRSLSTQGSPYCTPTSSSQKQRFDMKFDNSRSLPKSRGLVGECRQRSLNSSGDLAISEHAHAVARGERDVAGYMRTYPRSEGRPKLHGFSGFGSYEMSSRRKLLMSPYGSSKE